MPAAFLLVLCGPTGPLAASGQPALTRIGSAPKLSAGAVDLGTAPASTTVSGTVLMRPRDEHALEAFIAGATHKGSPQFGRYLTKGQFAARFGPEAGTLDAVRTTLQAAGLQVRASAESSLAISFSGRAAQVGAAFGTTLHRYRLRSGSVITASTSAPALPQQLAGSVVAVEGLGGARSTHPARVRPSAALAARFPAAKAPGFPHPAGSPDACPEARSAASHLGGLTDDQIANAYGAFGLYGAGDTGAGVHIGVFEEESFSYADMKHFDACYFGAQAAAQMAKRLHVISFEGGLAEGPGLDGEALLDIEDVSATAPGAEIDVYENPESPAGEVSEIAAMVDEDRDQIVTSSYGQPCEEEEEEGQPGTQEALNFLFQQGAAQGQTFLGAAGDSGSDNCEEVHRETIVKGGQNPLSGGETASQPYVLAVGGTTITDATQPVQEHVWNDGAEGGAGGGGISRAFAMPSWQRAAGVPGIDAPGSADYENAASVERSFGYPTGFCDEALAGAGPTTPCRLDPDVSAQADEFTGAVTVYSEEYLGEGEEASPDGWITSGGTSSATPIWAGMLALADASATCRSNPSTAGGVGFVTPLLYAIASNPSDYAASFNDVIEGDNDQYGLDDGKVYPARKGFDLASGLGSPRMTGPGGSAGLAYYLCSFAGATAARPAVTALSPGFGSTKGGETVEVTGSGFESSGKPDVAGVLVGTWQVPAGSIDVTGPGSMKVTMPPASDTLPADSPAAQDGAGPADIVVSLEDGQSSSTGAAARFEYEDEAGSAPVPGITGMVPTGGSETAPAPVTILGSDFDAATSVTFGGVKAPSFKILGDSQIQVTPPAYSSATACSPLPSTGVYAGENATNDICQVQVAVHDAGAASAASAILPPVEGAAAFEQDGALIAPAGCGCEVYPTPSEYDYAPAPQITSVSTSDGPTSLASETNETLVTLHGVGLNRFTFLYTDFGPSFEEASLNSGPAPYWQTPAYITGTEIQIQAPALAEEGEEAPTVGPETVPVSVRTLAASSPAASVEYAGVPRVTEVQSTASKRRLKGHSGVVDTGGTPLLVKGAGFSGQLTRIEFSEEGELVSGTQYTFTAEGETGLRTETVSQNPGLVDTRACTVSGCSPSSVHGELYLYPPGQPLVESLSPAGGPAAGGTAVRVRGQNLGCPLAVDFGGKKAEAFTAGAGLLGCGSTEKLRATSPPGKAGKSVPVTLETLESYFTQTGDAPSPARFTYSG